jgi:hypothetical protein
MEKAGKERDKENDKLVYLCKPSVNLDAIVWLDSKALMYVLFIQEVTCYDM